MLLLLFELFASKIFNELSQTFEWQVFKKWFKNIKITVFFISPKWVDIIAEAGMFCLILLSCYPFYIIPPWALQAFILHDKCQVCFKKVNNSPRKGQ